MISKTVQTYQKIAKRVLNNNHVPMYHQNANTAWLITLTTSLPHATRGVKLISASKTLNIVLYYFSTEATALHLKVLCHRNEQMLGRQKWYFDSNHRYCFFLIPDSIRRSLHCRFRLPTCSLFSSIKILFSNAFICNKSLWKINSVNPKGKYVSYFISFIQILYLL